MKRVNSPFLPLYIIIIFNVRAKAFLTEKEGTEMKRYTTIGNRIGRATKSCHRGLLSLLLCILSPLCLFTACSTIDEDLTDCDYEYHIDYELKLITNIETELQTHLNGQTDPQLSDALKAYLEDVFTDRARDVHLSFYDTGDDMMRLRQKDDVIDADHVIYSIDLPMRDYMHLAVANLEKDPQVTLKDDDYYRSSHLATTVTGDTPDDPIDSQMKGIFAGRQSLDIKENKDQTFDVDLYMVNSAVAVVLDPQNVDIKDVKVYTTGFATGYNVNDNTYTFSDTDPIVRANEVKNASDQLGFVSVNFPSRDKAEGDEPLWNIIVYVTLADGSVTETILKVSEPLKAGELKIVQGLIDRDGSVRTENSEIAISVIFDWNPGLEIEY